MNNKSLAYRNLKGTIFAPINVISQNDVKMPDFIRFLIEWHFPESTSILDPTPGDKNYMFSKYLERSSDCEWIYAGKYRYVAYSIDTTKWSSCGDSYNQIDVLHQWPIDDESFDVVVYDPPYLPLADHDKRAKDYGIDGTVGIASVKKFYNVNVISEALRVSKHGIIVKGSDFYYPPASYNFYSFMHDILPLDFLRERGSIGGVYIFRFFHNGTGLYRARLAKKWRRPVLVNSYYVVVYKGDYMPPSPYES